MADLEDDKPFQHFSKKQRAVAWVSQTFFDRNVYRSRQGVTRGLLRKGGLAFIPEFLTGKDQTPEARFWEQLNLKDRVVYDVGAFHGLLSCFFASQARRVVSYEPTPPSRQRLVENLQLNSFTNVTVRPCGLGATPGSVRISWDPLTPGAARFNAEKQQGWLEETVPVVRLDADIQEQNLPFPDFVKIDVEGLELDVLQGASGILNTPGRPALFLEMHGETMNEKRRKTAEIVECLERLGYPEIIHVESGERVRTATSGIAARGHLFCPTPTFAATVVGGAVVSSAIN